jgi:tRNA-specific 2-thiouridylase
MKDVIIAMSGGIDSSVAMFLLKKQRYKLRGVTMQNGSMPENEIDDARTVAQQNGVEWELIDVEMEFKEAVEKYFIDSYAVGLTPNPCAMCNRKIKFGFLMNLMRKKYGDVYYATGHYAKIIKDEEDCFLTLARDEKKDQSYFLSTIKKEYLSDILFPLANLTKEEVREIAVENGIKTAKKPDSQEICFIEDDNYRKYLLDNGMKPRSGKFIFSDGTPLGEHQGTFNYTIGQRRGLGISYSEKLFVKNIDVEKNEVLLDVNENMYNSGLIADRLNLYIKMENRDELSKKMIKCRVRSNAKLVNAKIKWMNDKIEILFTEKQFAISPGQLCVVYDEDKVVLSGKIIEIIN